VKGLDLANYITEIIIDRQGENILILDLQEVTTFTDYFVICTGTSKRQLDALQSVIRAELKKGDLHLLAHSIEGDAETGWILLDYNSVIIHLFTPDMREFYNLEELWKNGHIVTHIQ
jgi:ribosome-associated protein